MVMEYASCLGVSNNIIPQNSEQLNYLLAEIEAEFYNSEIYLQALTSLGKIITNSDRHIYSLEETTTAAPKKLITTCKQAIKIAFQQVNKSLENLKDTTSTNTNSNVVAEKPLWAQNYNCRTPVLEKTPAIIPTWSGTQGKIYTNGHNLPDSSTNHRSPVNITTSLWKKISSHQETNETNTVNHPETKSQNLIQQEKKNYY